MSTTTNEATLIKTAPAPLKAETVRRLLLRKNGATAAEIGAATTWQPHSVRAFVTGLRKKGWLIVFEPRSEGTKAYRMTQPVKGSANA